MPATTSPVVAEAITSANRTFMDAFRRRDAAAIAALYTSSAAVRPPGGDTVQGPVAIQRFWEGAFALGLTAVTLESTEVEAGDAFAFEVGRYTMTAGEQAADEGKYMIVWKQDGDRWMIHRDIWNTNRAS